MRSDTCRPLATQAAVAQRRARRWWSRLPLIAGLLSLGVWLLPPLIAVTPLRHLVLRMAETRLPEGVSVGSAQLSWDKPVRLNDVRVEDQAGREVLHVDRIESQETLWELARERLQRGLFHVFRPRLTLTIREHSTALDPGVVKLLQRQQAALAAGPAERGLEFELANGEVRLVDPQGQLLTEITGVVLRFRNEAGASGPGLLHASGQITQPPTGGEVAIEAEWTGRTPATSAGHISLRLDRVPVDALNPRVRRYLGERRLGGEASGSLEVHWTPVANGGTESQSEFRASDIRLTLNDPAASDTAPAWSLQDLTAHCRAVNEGTDAIHIEDLRIESRPLRAAVAGTITRRDAEAFVDLEGELISDPQKLLEFLGQSLPGSLRVEGLSARRLVLHGPVSTVRAAIADVPPAVEPRGTAELGWAALEVGGIESIGGVVSAEWQPGRLGLTPRRMPVSGGRIVALPWIDLGPSRQSLVFDPGLLAENIELTPAMTRSWIRYVSPLMSDAAAVSGRVSLRTDGGRVPVAAPQTGEVRGVLQIHEAQLAPGPLAQQIVPLLEQVRQLLDGRWPRGGRAAPMRAGLTAPRQEVAVRLANGRVYHERMEFTAAGTVVVSSGSVGLDESLDLVIELPLSEKWLPRAARGTAEAGEPLRIPVGGTLRQPVVDRAPLAELNRRFATQAAEGLLHKLLGP